MGRKYHIYFYDSYVWCHLILVLVIRCYTAVQRGNKPIYLNRIQGNLRFPKNRRETRANRPLKTRERPPKNFEMRKRKRTQDSYLSTYERAAGARRAIFWCFKRAFVILIYVPRASARRISRGFCYDSRKKTCFDLASEPRIFGAKISSFVEIEITI